MLVLEMISRTAAINCVISYKETRVPLFSKREQVPLTSSKSMHDSPLDYTASVGLRLVTEKH